MATIETSDGPVEIGNWAYQLQGRGGNPLDAGRIAAIDADLVVIDHSRDGTDDGAFSEAEVAAMQGDGAGRKVLLSYISIGEVEDFRDTWNEAWTKNGKASGALTAAAPDWLGPLNPDWPESRKVRYWDPDWQAIAFERIEAIAGQGFDGAYLDIVDAYYFWAHEARAADREPGDPRSGSKAAALMIDFIVDLAAHARTVNPDFVLIQQNAAFLLNDLVYDTGGKPKADPARIAALHDAIAGIAVEDAYLRGGRDENNRFRPDNATIRELKESYGEAGEIVFSVDYADDPGLVDRYLGAATADGFLAYAAPDRDLDRIARHGTAASDVLEGGAARDRIYGLGRDDEILGRGDADVLLGNRGDDSLLGGGGADELHGNRGEDRLAGEGGADRLAGGRGADVFVFAPGDGRDTILDFAAGDRIDLTAFDDALPMRIRNGGDGAVIEIGDVRITVAGLARADLDRDDDFVL